MLSNFQRTLSLAFLACCMGAGSAVTQEVPPPLQAELAGIRNALERIAGLLERQTETSSTELVFRRLDLITREASPLESELNGLRTGMTAHEARVAEAESGLTALREQLDGASLPEGVTSEELQRQVESLQADIAGGRRLLDVLRKRRAELEVQLMANAAERAEWKRYLDQKLARLSQQ